MTVQANSWQWVPLAYLHYLLSNGTDPEQARFFRSFLRLSGHTSGGARDALHTYAARLRDTILPVAGDLASNPAIQAQVGANGRDQLLASIAATLYLKPGDPICGALYEELPESLHSQIDDARRSVLKRWRAFLLARDDLKSIAASRLGDVEGHGAERVGVKALSHHARESLLFALIFLLSPPKDAGSPAHGIATFRAALGSLITRLGNSTQEGLRDLTAPPQEVPEAHSALFQAVRTPILIDLNFAEKTERAFEKQERVSTSDAATANQVHAKPEDCRPGELAHILRVLQAELREMKLRRQGLTKDSGTEADSIERKIGLLTAQISALAAELAGRRRSKLLEAARQRVRLYYPVLLKLSRLMQASEEPLKIAGQTVPAQDFFRLCFAAQRISFLAGRRYTHTTRAQMLRDLFRVFQAKDDPATGDALAAFEKFAETRAKELFGPAYDRLLGQIVESVVSNKDDTRDDALFGEVLQRARKSLDDCLDTDLDRLNPAASANLDLTDPAVFLNLYQKALYLLYLRQRDTSRRYPRERAALKVLEASLRNLAAANFSATMNALLGELKSIWPQPMPRGPWNSSRVLALQRAIESVWSAQFVEQGEAGIMGNAQLRRHFFLSQIANELLDIRSKRLSAGDAPTEEVDAARAKRFFTQTFKPNLEAGKRNWPRDEWEHLAHRLVRALPAYQELDQRVTAQFGTVRLRGPQELYRKLLDQRVDGVAFAEFFARAVTRCLSKAPGQIGATR